MKIEVVDLSLLYIFPYLQQPHINCTSFELKKYLISSGVRWIMEFLRHLSEAWTKAYMQKSNSEHTVSYGANCI